MSLSILVKAWPQAKCDEDTASLMSAEASVLGTTAGNRLVHQTALLTPEMPFGPEGHRVIEDPVAGHA